MGKIIATEFITLDGVIEEPIWSMPKASNDELQMSLMENLIAAG